MNDNSWRLGKIFDHKRGNNCPCPTPPGALFGGGWDTNRASQPLTGVSVGGVPSVPPLNALLRMRVRVCAHTPEKVASGGGTRGTKYEQPSDGPKSPISVYALSPPGWDSHGTGVGQS